MSRSVVAGLDGSPESRAAAEWAAREAALRGLPLRLVHVTEPVPSPVAQAPTLGAETLQHWAERIPREAAEGLRLRHPGVDVSVEPMTGAPAEALLSAAKDAELLVLGSRGLSGVGGFLVGSVGLAVVAHAELPVVLVRADGRAGGRDEGHAAGAAEGGGAAVVAAGDEEHAAGSAATARGPVPPVVVGLAADAPADEVIEFAFAEAARLGTGLRVVHGGSVPPYYAYGLAVDAGLYAQLSQEGTEALTEVLGPWQRKHPQVDVVVESHVGSVADHLVDASREAAVLVIGRRIRRAAFGAHIGPVAHAVLHHATVPVAVVAHD
ncbi:universal stress protein [Streptomyces mangrovisoli]|uniref:Stress-inducible protein n=1 Tax=Streptomyces mangrovisoli TaxID=1428628 RepID=A0A1J4P7P5_9ACTN|nr:universal stress protein [Streptomyces mangrovisoli]OIJ69780.1 stress-inducible protein [Streptomyces mangrovisoli]